MSEFLSLAETAQLLRASRQSVRRWARAGKLPRPARVGRKYLFRRSGILAALEAGRCELQPAG